MTDLPAGTGADPGNPARLEAWYRERCKPISEICLVPLDGHVHAIIVPDFALLQEQRHPNSRELLRFEFHEISKQLGVEDRPDTFSLRSTPLPRRADGEPDRERLRAEIAERSSSFAQDPDTPDNPAANAIRGLIRACRPLAACSEDANLELDLGFDSLDRVLLISSVEQMLGISIPDSKAAQMITVGQLVEAAQRPGRDVQNTAAVALSEILRQPLNRAEQSLAMATLKQRPGLTFLAWSIARMLRLARGRRFHFEIKGREWLALKPPYLIAANHCSHLDPLFLLWALPYSVARRVSFMGHTEYFGRGWKAAVSKRLKLVAVDPDEHARSGMRLSAEALRRGMIGMVFPEGERSPNGAQQRFHRGLAVLARERNLPILPVAICGSYEVLPRGCDRIRYAPVQIRIGAPIVGEQGETEQNLLARVWMAVRQLRGADARPRERMPVPMGTHWEQMI